MQSNSQAVFYQYYKTYETTVVFDYKEGNTWVGAAVPRAGAAAARTPTQMLKP